MDLFWPTERENKLVRLWFGGFRLKEESNVRKIKISRIQFETPVTGN